MEIQEQKISVGGIKFFIQKDGREVARAYLYILKNDLHAKPFGFLEDVFVDESERSQGLGKQIVKAVMEAARREGCYKLVGTSRYEREKVHQMYENLGFKDYGKEFRIDF